MAILVLLLFLCTVSILLFLCTVDSLLSEGGVDIEKLLLDNMSDSDQEQEDGGDQEHEGTGNAIRCVPSLHVS